MRTTNWDGRGIEKQGPVGSNGSEKKEKTQTPIEKVKESAKTMIRSIFWAAAIVAAESIAIWWIWNYVVTEHPLSYIKTYLMVIMVRLILRSTTKMSDLK